MKAELDVSRLEENVDYVNFNIGIGDDGTPTLLCEFKDEFSGVIFEYNDIYIEADGNIKFTVNILSNFGNVDVDSPEFREKVETLFFDIIEHTQT